MEKGRKLVISIGALVIIIMGWIAWITFKTPLLSESPEGVNLPQPEMVQLRHDLTEFISERFKSERPSCQLLEVSLGLPSLEGQTLKVPYDLSFKDQEKGVQSSLSAVAFLERSGEQWKVTKVAPQKETIVYDQTAVVKSDTAH